MNFFAYVIFSLMVLFAFYSEIHANGPLEENEKCVGTNDRRCPQILCGPEGVKGWRQQDNEKPFPKCCGGPIC